MLFYHELFWLIKYFSRKICKKTEFILLNVPNQAEDGF